MNTHSDVFSLSGKTIVVSGASSGIGRQCAISFSQMGAYLVLLGRNEGRLAETLSLTKDPGQHSTYVVDLLDFEKVDAVVKDIAKQKGKVHGLVCCAGISTTLPIKMGTPDKLNEFLHTNVTASFNLARLLSGKKNMAAEGGGIVFISSVMGIVGEVGKTLYSITKGALISGSRSMALELAPRKIRVNCISPGVVLSPMSKNAIYSRNEESLTRITELHPLGLGAPEDVANTCVYLLSEASRWVTGTNLVVDGGYSAR